MRTYLLCAFVAVASAASAVDVGIFDNTRMLDPVWNCQDGGVMTGFTSAWAARGAVWHQTPTLTSSFLSTVSVFYTGEIDTANFTADEQTAAVNWVKGGGTLVVTCDCPCESNQAGYDTLLNNFGINDTSVAGPLNGTILNAHRVTYGITAPSFGVHGTMTGPSDALQLIKDTSGNLVAMVLQGTPEVGNGRLLVISDNDVFSDFYVMSYPQDQTFLESVADWALMPYTVSGTVTLDSAAGSPAGLPVQLGLYDKNGLLETFSTTLDGSGNYSVRVDYPGTLDVLAKPHKWLSVRSKGVNVVSSTSLNVEFTYGGDADDSNAINILDLSIVLADYGLTGDDDGDVNLSGKVGIADISLILLNYNMAGDK